MAILDTEEESKQTEAFRRYFKNPENVKKLQKVFPVMITTCISAHRIGEPKPLFNMVILDEASQCNTAVSLVPIIRVENSYARRYNHIKEILMDYFAKRR